MGKDERFGMSMNRRISSCLFQRQVSPRHTTSLPLNRFQFVTVVSPAHGESERPFFHQSTHTGGRVLCQQ